MSGSKDDDVLPRFLDALASIPGFTVERKLVPLPNKVGQSLMVKISYKGQVSELGAPLVYGDALNTWNIAGSFAGLMERVRQAEELKEGS